MARIQALAQELSYAVGVAIKFFFLIKKIKIKRRNNYPLFNMWRNKLENGKFEIQTHVFLIPKRVLK